MLQQIPGYLFQLGTVPEEDGLTDPVGLIQQGFDLLVDEVGGLLGLTLGLSHASADKDFVMA